MTTVTRDELTGLAIEIKMKTGAFPHLKITDIPRVQRLAKETPLYLINCKVPGRATSHFSILSREEMPLIPPEFVKLDKDVEFYSFEGGEHDYVWLLELGLIR